MAGKSYYHRSFIILKSESKGYEFIPNKDPTGYCKFEIRRGVGKAYIYIQDIKPSSSLDGSYEAYLISLDDSIGPCKLAGLYVDEQGRCEHIASFDADNIEGSGKALEDFHALLIVYRLDIDTSNIDISYPLIGYSGKSISMATKLITERFKEAYGKNLRLMDQTMPQKDPDFPSAHKDDQMDKPETENGIDQSDESNQSNQSAPMANSKDQARTGADSVDLKEAKRPSEDKQMSDMEPKDQSKQEKESVQKAKTEAKTKGQLELKIDLKDQLKAESALKDRPKTKSESMQDPLDSKKDESGILSKDHKEKPAHKEIDKGGIIQAKDVLPEIKMEKINGKVITNREDIPGDEPIKTDIYPLGGDAVGETLEEKTPKEKAPKEKVPEGGTHEKRPPKKGPHREKAPKEGVFEVEANKKKAHKEKVPEERTSGEQLYGESIPANESRNRDEDLRKAYEDTYLGYLDDFSWGDPQPKGTTYWDNVKDYYEGLFRVHQSVSPFGNDLDKGQWVKVPQAYTGFSGYYTGMTYGYGGYNYPYSNHHIVGIMKEKERVKYIIYGVPSGYNMIPPLSTSGFTRWVSTKDGYGMGYWLLYIDGVSGRIIYPHWKE